MHTHIYKHTLTHMLTHTLTRTHPNPQTPQTRQLDRAENEEADQVSKPRARSGP